MTDLSHYSRGHKKELELLLSSDAWQQAIEKGKVEEAADNRLEPPPLRDFLETVTGQLEEFNIERVAGLIKEGETDRDTLLKELTVWPPYLNGKSTRLSFVGINLTSKCNMDPKCIYCNQPDTPPEMSLDGWKKVIHEVTDPIDEKGPYIFITGGEPLTVGADLWGTGGLIAYATKRGAAVNVNTNAVDLTPEVALSMIRSGLSKLHVSLDSADPETQNGFYQGDYFDRILEGLYNVQLARDLTGATYPVIHLNCVLTNRNLDSFPDLFSFILEKHKQTADKDDPFFNDLFPHVIPVGGEGNEHLRPTAADFRRFYDYVWPQVTEMWDRFQAGLSVPEDKRGVLFGYFSNPFLRVMHKGGLDAYVQASAEGLYGKLALTRACHVTPTQVCFSPDGIQYRCGSHAIRRILPLGDAKTNKVFDLLREGESGEIALPKEDYCSGCALATLYINQGVEFILKSKLKKMLSNE